MSIRFNEYEGYEGDVEPRPGWDIKTNFEYRLQAWIETTHDENRALHKWGAPALKPFRPDPVAESTTPPINPIAAGTDILNSNGFIARLKTNKERDTLKAAIETAWLDTQSYWQRKASHP